MGLQILRGNASPFIANAESGLLPEKYASDGDEDSVSRFLSIDWEFLRVCSPS